MAELTFRYSTMNAGKSIDILKIAHNYEEGGKHVMLFTSSLDNRYGTGVIASRIGLKRDAIAIGPNDNLLIIFAKKYEEMAKNGDKISCVLVDEGQFLTEKQVLDLTKIVDHWDVPVVVYGLKNDFQNNLFEGSQALLRFADNIEEIKTICLLCERKGTMVLRINENGEPVFEGEQIKIGGNESYIPVCRKCYYTPTYILTEKIRNALKKS